MIEIVENKASLTNILLEYFPNYILTNDPYEHGYVYKINNKIIGIILYSIIYDRAELNYIVVLEKYRHQKIGEELLEKCLKDLKNKAVENITLEVNKNNKAVQFYLKNGFIIKAIRKNYYKTDDAYLMIKEVI